MRTESEAIDRVLKAFFDPRDAHSPGSNQIWQKTPELELRRVLGSLEMDWTEQQIVAFTQLLMDPTMAYKVILTENAAASGAVIVDALKTMQPGYTTALIMNVLTFGVGLSLLVGSVYAATQGHQLAGALGAVGGVIGVATTFVRGPILEMQRSVCSHVQLEVAYTSFTKQLGYWKQYESVSDLDIKKTVVAEIGTCMQRAMSLIEKYCEVPLTKKGHVATQEATSAPNTPATGESDFCGV